LHAPEHDGSDKHFYPFSVGVKKHCDRSQNHTLFFFSHVAKHLIANSEAQKSMFSSLAEGIAEIDKEKVLDEVKRRVSRKEDPIRIVEECRDGMRVVGDRYQKGEYFLAELLLSAEIFRQAMEIVEPYLAKIRPPKPRGKVVLATLKGDIHDLGKNLLAILLKTRGFEVYDLGVDVDPVRVVEKVKEVKPEFVGFSALISAAFDSMKTAVEMFEKEGLRKKLKVMVGGGITTPLVKDYIGADFQTLDALEGVTYCLSIVEGKKEG